MDVADILGVKGGEKESEAERVFNSSTRRQSSAPSSGSKPGKKIKGMKREVAALIGKGLGPHPNTILIDSDMNSYFLALILMPVVER